MAYGTFSTAYRESAFNGEFTSKRMEVCPVVLINHCCYVSVTFNYKEHGLLCRGESCNIHFSEHKIL